MEHSPAFREALAAYCRVVPSRAAALRAVVAAAHANSASFGAAFDALRQYASALLQRENAQPDPLGVFPPHLETWSTPLTCQELDEWLVGHLLLARLIRCAFPQAVRCNRLARALTAVIAVLGQAAPDLVGVLAPLDGSYVQFEREWNAAENALAQQQVLCSWCEAFFTAFDRQQAEEFGVIYTPIEVVQFQCESVEVELQRKFGRSLSSRGVPILDPACGIGVYPCYALGRIGSAMRQYKYLHEVYAIEIMVVPAYLARLNIEQTFVRLQGYYLPFPGLRVASALA